MKIVLFDTKSYDRKHFDDANRQYGYEIVYHEPELNVHTAVMARGADVVCPFVNCTVDRPVIDILSDLGVKLIAMRSAGFNNVDYKYALEKGIAVVRVPAYSPYAVAEHSFAMLLALVRKLTHAYVRTREFNFSLTGLVGMDLHGKTFGAVGTGKIGRVAIDIARGFGMRILAYDPYPAQLEGVQYVDLETLLRQSDVVSLYCPLTKENTHMIDEKTLSIMKDTALHRPERPGDPGRHPCPSDQHAQRADHIPPGIPHGGGPGGDQPDDAWQREGIRGGQGSDEPSQVSPVAGCRVSADAITSA